MKTLYVFRHAKAERDSETGPDFDRPLAEQGWRDAELVGREMRARGLDVDGVLASPAKRAMETVAAFARGYGAVDPVYEPGIYNAPVGRLLDIVSNADDSIERLLMVGHNPGFEELVRHLADEWLAEGLPTAGLVAIELSADRWSDVPQRTGRISARIAPRDLRD